MPDKAGYAETGRRATDLPAVEARRTMVEAGHADAAPAERRCALQARTAEEIDPSAGLSQMSAQLLRDDRTQPLCSGSGRTAVALVRRIERSFRGKAWCDHPTTPVFNFSRRGHTPENNFARPTERVAARGTGLHSRARCSGAIRKRALTGLPSARPAHWRVRTATRGRTIAKPSVATRIRAAGRAGPRAASGLGRICEGPQKV